MIILTGKTATGKDTIKRELLKIPALSPIVTYTTRKKRDNERDGVDYHFVSIDKYMSMRDNGELIACNCFTKSNEGDVWYGVAKKDLINADTDNKVIILDAHGVKDFQKIRDDVGFSDIFLIDTVPEEQWERLISRGNDTVEECQRRVLADNADFADIQYNHLVINRNVSDIKQIAYTIYTYYLIDKGFTMR